ncbi:hypothetical protein HDU93_001658 [Gonapodya sp. JEL0774]|nr:hypothetical protein HDU93_001658 [Gonapodya sp. JEL0774]
MELAGPGEEPRPASRNSSSKARSAQSSRGATSAPNKARSPSRRPASPALPPNASTTSSHPSSSSSYAIAVAVAAAAVAAEEPPLPGASAVGGMVFGPDAGPAAMIGAARVVVPTSGTASASSGSRAMSRSESDRDRGRAANAEAVRKRYLEQLSTISTHLTDLDELVAHLQALKEGKVPYDADEIDGTNTTTTALHLLSHSRALLLHLCQALATDPNLAPTDRDALELTAADMVAWARRGGEGLAKVAGVDLEGSAETMASAKRSTGGAGPKEKPTGHRREPSGSSGIAERGDRRDGSVPGGRDRDRSRSHSRGPPSIGGSTPGATSYTGASGLPFSFNVPTTPAGTAAADLRNPRSHSRSGSTSQLAYQFPSSSPSPSDASPIPYPATTGYGATTLTHGAASVTPATGATQAVIPAGSGPGLGPTALQPLSRASSGQMPTQNQSQPPLLQFQRQPSAGNPSPAPPSPETSSHSSDSGRSAGARGQLMASGGSGGREAEGVALPGGAGVDRRGAGSPTSSRPSKQTAKGSRKDEYPTPPIPAAGPQTPTQTTSADIDPNSSAGVPLAPASLAPARSLKNLYKAYSELVQLVEGPLGPDGQPPRAPSRARSPSMGNPYDRLDYHGSRPPSRAFSPAPYGGQPDSYTSRAPSRALSPTPRNSHYGRLNSGEEWRPEDESASSGAKALHNQGQRRGVSMQQGGLELGHETEGNGHAGGHIHAPASSTWVVMDNHGPPRLGGPGGKSGSGGLGGSVVAGAASVLGAPKRGKRMADMEAEELNHGSHVYGADLDVELDKSEPPKLTVRRWAYIFLVLILAFGGMGVALYFVFKK